MSPNCGDCTFFQKSDNTDNTSGECRINPPSAFVKDTPWPQVSTDDWCAKYRENDQGPDIKAKNKHTIDSIDRAIAFWSEHYSIKFSAEQGFALTKHICNVLRINVDKDQ